MPMQLFVVQPPEGNYSNVKFICWASGREDAKRKAYNGWLSGYGDTDMDHYVVTPITNPGDRVKLDITLNI